MDEELRKWIAGRLGNIDLDVVPKQQKSQTSQTPLPSVSPATTQTALATTIPVAGMTFDEAISRVRMITSMLPRHRLREMIPILTAKLKEKVLPEDRDTFETVVMGMVPEEEEEDTATLRRMLPLLLIMSMMRRD